MAVSVVSAKQSGLVGDGTTNDTAALAVAYAATPVGGLLYFEAGTYILDPFTIAKQISVKLHPGATLKTKAAASSALYSGFITITAAFVTFEGGTVDGNKANQTDTDLDGITVKADDVTVQRVLVKDTKRCGIYGRNCNRAKIRLNNISNTDYIGIFVQTDGVNSVADNEIVGNTVDRSTISAGSVTEGGLKVHGDSGSITATRTRVDSNTVKMPASPSNGTAVCIEVTYAPYSTVDGNSTTGGAMGVSLAASDFSTTNNNVVYGPKSYGIENAGSRGATIANNVIDGASLATHGIILSAGGGNNADDTSITGGTITGCTARGIKVQLAVRVGIGGGITVKGTTGYVVEVASADGLTLSGFTLDGLGTALKGVMVDSTSRVAIGPGTIRNTTQHGVLLFSSTNGYTIQLVTITGVIFETVNVSIGTQVSGGAAVGTTIKMLGCPGQAEVFDLANLVLANHGTGTPEGVVTAGVGSTFRRRDGGAGTAMYVKESGSGNTGWVGK